MKYLCNQENCTYFTTASTNLKTHNARKHGIITTLYYCKYDDCNYIFKDKSILIRHKSFKHEEKTYTCGECSQIIKGDKSNLKRHIKDQHTSNFKKHICKYCKHIFKNKSNLDEHLSNIHDIGVIWYSCTESDCNFKSKSKSTITKHLNNTHELNVTWHECQENECNYQSKQKHHLRRHLEQMHDIGDYRCDFCFQNRNSHIPYKEHCICRDCFNKITGKHSRIEYIWSDYVDQELGIEYLLSSDKSLKSQGGCSLRRPDKLYVGVDRVEIDECDEYQHSYNNGNYSCEEERLMEIYDEPEIIGKQMIVIRWNPHSYKKTDTKLYKSLDDRLKQFVDLKRKLRKNPPKDKIHVYYMFYDLNNPHVVKNIPHTMIY